MTAYSLSFWFDIFRHRARRWSHIFCPMFRVCWFVAVRNAHTSLFTSSRSTRPTRLESALLLGLLTQEAKLQMSRRSNRTRFSSLSLYVYVRSVPLFRRCSSLLLNIVLIGRRHFRLHCFVFGGGSILCCYWSLVGGTIWGLFKTGIQKVEIVKEWNILRTGGRKSFECM